MQGEIMRNDRDLQRELERIDRRGYPAYKDLRGQYDFGDFVLSIDHAGIRSHRRPA